MIISGLNRGAPKDFMNGSLAATSSSGEQRAQRARQQEFYTCYYRSGSVRHTWRQNSSPYSQGQAAHCELRCAARSPPADGHAARTGLPTDLAPLLPPPPSPGKHDTAAFTGLMG